MRTVAIWQAAAAALAAAALAAAALAAAALAAALAAAEVVAAEVAAAAAVLIVIRDTGPAGRVPLVEAEALGRQMAHGTSTKATCLSSVSLIRIISTCIPTQSPRRTCRTSRMRR